MEATMQEEFDKQKVKESAEACVWNYMSESPKEDIDNIVEWMVDFYKAGFKDKPVKEPYSWVIEQNSTSKYSNDGGKTYKWAPWSGWYIIPNHKIYGTKRVALEAIDQMIKSDGNCRISRRILSVYSGEPEVLDNILDLPLKIEEDGKE